ncbi:MAG: FMN-binding protein [Phycisphaerales bacterium]|nr:MAG: FMN-binding protein [Phycisphaerales bacterium]
MTREKRWFPILYMFVVTALFSSIVIGFTGLTRRRVEANAALAFERAVVAVFPELYEANMGSLEIHRVFTEQISEPDATSGGAYTYEQAGQVTGYALPFAGQGFWAPIEGVIGIDTDRKTVRGIAFYEQNETPGLGAEIVKPPFKKQFEGKVLAAGDKPIRFCRPGADLGASDVHAVTGATQTSTRVEGIINEAVKQWQSEVGRKGDVP